MIVAEDDAFTFAFLPCTSSPHHPQTQRQKEFRVPFNVRHAYCFVLTYCVICVVLQDITFFDLVVDDVLVDDGGDAEDEYEKIRMLVTLAGTI
jgi:hypothetical protein